MEYNLVVANYVVDWLKIKLLKIVWIRQDLAPNFS